MSAPPVVALFDRVAQGYDAERRLLLPDFDAFYGAAIEAVGAPPRGGRVLDIGAGTGLFSAMLAARRPDLCLVLFDASPAMLAEAARRFAALGIAAETCEGDLAGPLPEGPFDAAVSALAIHHLAHAQQADLLARLAGRLAPGARFVEAEQVAEATEAAEAAAVRRWEAAVRAAGASEAVLEAARARMAHDRCATPERRLDWLARAGFRSELVWRRGRFAVFRSERPVAAAG